MVDNAPTTRETADHAELAVENEDCETCDGAGEVEARIGFGTDYIPCPDCVSRDHKAEKAALLSEIAALRGERNEAHQKYVDANEARIDVERQRDEARAVLTDIRDVPYTEQEWPRSRALNFLANQGADQ